MRKYSDYLSDKEKEKVIVIPEYTPHAEVNELRQLVEDCTEWMSIGSYSKKTPQYMITKFKSAMSRANKVKADNIRVRREIENG
tara:strand:- start:99 stop:350 length:252 start_codon:yes stop_codon:yes gene_type:complete